MAGNALRSRRREFLEWPSYLGSQEEFSARLCNLDSNSNYFDLLKGACWLEDEDAVEFVIKECPHIVKDRDENGRTGLMFASLRNNENILEMFIKNGSDVNAQDLRGMTALMFCCRGHSDHSKFVDLLINAAADISIHNNSGDDALYLACYYGQKNCVKLLLENGADVNSRYTNGETPLIQSCAGGHVEIADMLIKGGADVNAFDSGGRTALIYAGLYGYLTCPGRYPILDILFDNGASIDVVSENGRPALLHAIKGRDGFFTEWLLDRGADINARDGQERTPLMLFCEQRWKVDVEMLLLSRGADVNARDKDGRTALMYAAQFNRTNIAKILIKYGADLNVHDKDGATALIIACKNRAKEVIVILCSNGADVNCVDNSGRSAITVVWLHQKPIRMLLQAGASVDARRCKQRTLFMTACIFRNKPTMELLLRYGADINAQDETGVTPMMRACASGVPDILELLLHHNADVNMQDKFGTTAAMVAAETCNKECLEMLLLAGANLGLLDNRKASVYWFIVKMYLRFELNRRHSVFDHHCEWKDLESSIGLLGKIIRYVNVPQKLLIHACVNMKLGMVEKLLICGANVNTQDDRGATPLILACENLSFDVMELLLQYHADVNMQTSSGTTAVMIAIMKCSPKCIKLLIDAGANLDLKDGKSCTAFSYFIKYPSRENLRMFKQLFDTGKFSLDGKLKEVHYNAFNICKLYHAGLFIMECGIFEWKWCQFTRIEDSIFLSYFALNESFCPGEMAAQGWIGSPLILALVAGNIKATRQFLNRMYYFPEDYKRIISDSHLIQTLENSALVAEMTSKVLSLQTWSLLTASKAISLSGHPCGRSQRVNSLPLPNRFKDILKFKCDTHNQ